MIFVKNNNTDPYKNHAVEEFLMNKFDDDCFMLWKNDKCILIGRNQNVYNEVNMDYIKEHNIPIVRRITGGGAVFNDEGNFNFSFISCNADKDFTNFKKFVDPIIAVLGKFEVEVQLSGRNDLTIEGKKISGNAQCKYKDKVLHHGTLLFSSDVYELAHVLKVKDIKLKDKGIKSVKSRVANISDYLKFKTTTHEFKEYLFNEVLKNTEDAVLYDITMEDWTEIEEIAKKKYATWEWNFGNNPRFSIEKEGKFAGGIVQVYINIYKGIIKNIKIYGDFFSENNVSTLENALTSVKYDFKSIYGILEKYNMDEYFKNISMENIMSVLI